MSPVQSLALTSRTSQRGDAAFSARPVSFKRAPRQPGGTGFSLRGKVLYPALLTVLAVAAYLVGGKNDELR